MEVQILRSYDVCRLRSNATTDWNLSHTRLQQPRESNERHPRNCEVRGFRVVMGDKVRNIIVEYIYYGKVTPRAFWHSLRRHYI